MAGGTIKPDAVWFEESFVYLIFQLKSGLGLRSLQSLVAYSTIVEVTSPSRSRRLPFH